MTPVIESTSTIGSVGRVSKNVALTGTNVNNKSFWMCQECGHKFRNLEDMIQENKRAYKLGKILFRSSYIFFSVFCCLMGLLTKQMGMMIFTISLMIAAWYVSEKCILKKIKAKWDAEERKLRKSCFD